MSAQSEPEGESSNDINETKSVRKREVRGESYPTFEEDVPYDFIDGGERVFAYSV
mgnify:CR=1 FL=1